MVDPYPSGATLSPLRASQTLCLCVGCRLSTVEIGYGNSVCVTAGEKREWSPKQSVEGFVCDVGLFEIRCERGRSMTM